MQEQRRKAISDIINSYGSAKVSDLAQRFDKSEMTIHRDLDYLEDKGFIRKTHGGAIANSFSENYSYRSVTNLQEKQYIAHKAFELIENHDTIMIDGSTTAIELAKLLKCDKEITVFTHSPLILNELVGASNVTLFSIGSYFAREMMHFVGADVEDKIASYNFSKCFFGVAAVTDKCKLADSLPQLAEIKKRIIESSLISVVLADNSKFGRIAVENFAKVSDVDYLISDSKIPPKYIEKFSELTQLIY